MSNPSTKRVASDSSIEPYVKDCHKRSKAKCAEFFNFDHLLQIQRQHLFSDFTKHLFNVFYAPVYIMAKSFVFWLEEMGYSKAKKKFKKIPANWPTGFQKEVEKFLENEIFQISQQEDKEARKVLRLTLKEYNVRRAKKADLNTSTISILFGLLFFKNHSFSLKQLSIDWAEALTNYMAASDFFLGRGAGDMFYSLFPKEPSFLHLAFTGAFVFICFGAIIHIYCTLLVSFQIKYGLYFNRLKGLINRVHDELVLNKHGKASSGPFEF